MEMLLTPEQPRIPVRALAVSVAALAVPVSAAFFFPSALGLYSPLLWLLALVPAFLLAYYRGWRGIATALALGMALLSVTQALTVGSGTGVPDLLLWVVVAYIAIALGVGWLADALHRQRRAAEGLALTDAVTGLPNRRHVVQFLKGAFADAERGRPLAVVVFDLDHFKAYNDRHGHAAGDEALHAFGQMLADTTRRTDLSGRLGGEELVTVLCDGTEEGALSFAERVRQGLAALEPPHGDLTASAGIAFYQADMGSPEELLEAADSAVYRAKGDGRDCVRVFGRTREWVAAPAGASSSPATATAAPVGPATSALAATGAQGESEGRQQESVGGGRKVLLVEDDDAVRRSLARFLVREGFQVTDVASAFEAIQHLAAEYDIVVTDVQLPGASGIDLVAAVKSRRESTPTIVFTGLQEAAMAADALNAGADRYLFKPLDLLVLRRHLTDLLARRDRLAGGFES